jgi:hypothetical protein
MNKIFSSASKTVFVLLSLALVVLTFTGTVESKDFITLTSMAFTYYFAARSKKEENNLIT